MEKHIELCDIKGDQNNSIIIEIKTLQIIKNMKSSIIFFIKISIYNIRLIYAPSFTHKTFKYAPMHEFISHSYLQTAEIVGIKHDKIIQNIKNEFSQIIQTDEEELIEKGALLLLKKIISLSLFTRKRLYYHRSLILLLGVAFLLFKENINMSTLNKNAKYIFTTFIPKTTVAYSLGTMMGLNFTNNKKEIHTYCINKTIKDRFDTFLSFYLNAMNIEIPRQQQILQFYNDNNNDNNFVKNKKQHISYSKNIIIQLILIIIINDFIPSLYPIIGKHINTHTSLTYLISFIYNTHSQVKFIQNLIDEDSK